MQSHDAVEWVWTLFGRFECGDDKNWGKGLQEWEKVSNFAAKLVGCASGAVRPISPL